MVVFRIFCKVISLDKKLREREGSRMTSKFLSSATEPLVMTVII